LVPAPPKPDSEWGVVQSLAKSVPVVTGELGEYDCATTYLVSNDDKRVVGYLPFADTNGISYLGWAWNTASCGDGPSLITNYDGPPTDFGKGLKNHLAALANVAHNFNGDGKSDILWRGSGGGIAAWLMNGASVQSAVGIGSINNDWVIVG